MLDEIRNHSETSPAVNCVPFWFHQVLAVHFRGEGPERCFKTKQDVACSPAVPTMPHSFPSAFFFKSPTAMTLSPLFMWASAMTARTGSCTATATRKWYVLVRPTGLKDPSKSPLSACCSVLVTFAVLSMGCALWGTVNCLNHLGDVWLAAGLLCIGVRLRESRSWSCLGRVFKPLILTAMSF